MPCLVTFIVARHELESAWRCRFCKCSPAVAFDYPASSSEAHTCYNMQGQCERLCDAGNALSLQAFFSCLQPRMSSKLEHRSKTRPFDAGVKAPRCAAPMRAPIRVQHTRCRRGAKLVARATMEQENKQMAEAEARWDAQVCACSAALLRCV